MVENHENFESIYIRIQYQQKPNNQSYMSNNRAPGRWGVRLFDFQYTAFRGIGLR